MEKLDEDTINDNLRDNGLPPGTLSSQASVKSDDAWRPEQVMALVLGLSVAVAIVLLALLAYCTARKSRADLVAEPEPTVTEAMKMEAAAQRVGVRRDEFGMRMAQREARSRRAEERKQRKESRARKAEQAAQPAAEVVPSRPPQAHQAGATTGAGNSGSGVTASSSTPPPPAAVPVQLPAPPPRHTSLSGDIIMFPSKEYNPPWAHSAPDIVSADVVISVQTDAGVEINGASVDTPGSPVTREPLAISTQPQADLKDAALDARAAVVRNETIGEADAELASSNAENKFEASRVVSPKLLVLGKSADSDLMTFIGLDDQKLSAALADPMGVMEKEWFPFGFHVLGEEPPNNEDEEYRRELEEAHRLFRDGEIDAEELDDELQRVEDELEERKFTWWTTGANFDYITYGEVGDIDNYEGNFWLPPQVSPNCRQHA